MIVKYLGFFMQKIKDQTSSVSRWDTWNSTKFRNKVEKGKLTSEEVAKYNHEHLLGYEFCVLHSEKSLYPYCYVTIVPRNKHVGVYFIDNEGRTYLKYLFDEVKEDRTLFLEEVWFYQFIPGNSSEEQEYRMHFAFDQDGNYAARKYIDSKGKYEDYEGNQKLDFSGLYEKYPEFGQYEGIIQLERPVLNDIIS
ncbi:hypothetical protein A9G48_03915 [Gilliamella sp. wkB18]|uniref:hypothetical protein n=1 Tax=Gilliamella sp. wkB18 TaxID=3120260 RepID=UPI00080E5A27|nr:hypothetical protein [Gilliamella apicola]OCG64081.1 hypothetical protein A9G48_03915 [Gilliamella apicola]